MSKLIIAVLLCHNQLLQKLLYVKMSNCSIAICHDELLQKLLYAKMSCCSIPMSQCAIAESLYVTMGCWNSDVPQ